MESKAPKRKLPRWAGVLLAIIAFFAAVVTEELIREAQGVPLSGRPIGTGPALRIEGKVKPDFLWAGEAWRLTLTREGSEPLKGFLLVDGVAQDPPFLLELWPGIPQLLFRNHDHSNVLSPLPTRVGLRTETGTFEWSIERAP